MKWVAASLSTALTPSLPPFVVDTTQFIEGSHWARIRSTDTTGLQVVASRMFTIDSSRAAGGCTEARIEKFEAQARTGVATRLLEAVERRGDHGLVVGIEEGLSTDDVRALALQVRQGLGSGIGILGSTVDGKGVLVAFVSADLAGRGISAGTLLADAAAVLGGGGGRDPELSQAGGPHGERLPDAIEVAARSARSALEGL